MDQNEFNLNNKLITTPFAQQVVFNIEQLNYRFEKLQTIDTHIKQNQNEYLMVFDSFLVLFRAIFLENGNKQFSIQNYYNEKGEPEIAQSINDFLDSKVFEWQEITIRNVLKFLADKLICHVDSISFDELATANFYMSHLSNPAVKTNLQYIMNELNKIIKQPSRL